MLSLARTNNGTKTSPLSRCETAIQENLKGADHQGPCRPARCICIAHTGPAGRRIRRASMHVTSPYRRAICTAGPSSSLSSGPRHTLTHTPSLSRPLRPTCPRSRRTLGAIDRPKSHCSNATGARRRRRRGFPRDRQQKDLGLGLGSLSHGAAMARLPPQKPCAIRNVGCPSVCVRT